MLTDVAASSSSFTYGWNYHVFLSFRGENTRYHFTGHLCHNLQLRGIRTFIDDQGIRKGENISDALFEVIEESKTAIVVFSEDYASSTFCLKELTHIIRCMKGIHGRSIWCVFYHVNPSDVRHQRNSYTLDQHEGTDVGGWRWALKETADLCGWHLEPSDKEYEYKKIDEIIEAVSKEINDGPLYIGPFQVGLESQIKQVCSLLNKEPLCDGATMVGIYGIPGIGKSTLAQAVYNEIASGFKHLCFIPNIREQPIHELPKTLLSQTIWEKADYRKSAIPIIKDRLHKKKVLLLLDDIDKLEQLQVLTGKSNWFGSGSIIIITTTNKDLLMKHKVNKIYEVKELNDDEAGKLLSLHALGKNEVDPGYKDVLKRAVKYADGHPLILESLGSNLGPDFTVDEWEDTIVEYERNLDKKVHKTLEVSYNGLNETYKQVFLDIACFYKGCELEYVKYMLQCSRGISPESWFKVLMNKSLIKIDHYNRLAMHNLIQVMGQEIIRQISTFDPGRRSRLWSSEDILHVLKENTGTSEIQAIKLDLVDSKEVDWTGEAFEKMKNLRVLIIKGAKFSEGPISLPSSLRVLDWMNYPSSTLPSNFHPSNLVILKLRYSRLTLKNTFHQFSSLRCLNLEHNEVLTEVPDMSRASNLEELYVGNCTKLTTIDNSVGLLTNLRVLGARGCTSLTTFIEGGIKLTSLEILNLTGCSKFQNFPEILEDMVKIKTLALSGTAVETLPESIEKLVGLECLYLHGCRRLSQIPMGSIKKLKKLVRLEAGSCGVFTMLKDQKEKGQDNLVLGHVSRLHLNKNNISNEFLLEILGLFSGLRVLELRENNFTFLPECIKECANLKRLYLDGCKQLEEIRGIPPNIKLFSAINCMLLTQSSREILKQALSETAGSKKLILPGKVIPEWFQCVGTGSSVSFKVRKEFPEIVVCVVFEVQGGSSVHFEFEIQVLINNTQNFVGQTDVLDIETSHIYHFDNLRHQSWKGEVNRILVETEFSHVRISCTCVSHPNASDALGFVKHIGVYVCNLENFVDDILFEDSKLSRTALGDVTSDTDSKSLVYSDSSREDSCSYKYFQMNEVAQSSSDVVYLDDNDNDISNTEIMHNSIKAVANIKKKKPKVMIKRKLKVVGSLASASTTSASRWKNTAAITVAKQATGPSNFRLLETKCGQKSVNEDESEAEENDITANNNGSEWLLLEATLEEERVPRLTQAEIPFFHTDLHQQQYLASSIEKITESSKNVRIVNGNNIIVYRDNTDKENGSSRSEDPMEWEYQIACQTGQQNEQRRNMGLMLMCYNLFNCIASFFADKIDLRNDTSN